MNNQNIQQQLLEAFSIEARERIESMFSTLTELEKSIDPEKRQQGVEIVFREAHSLKGAARSIFRILDVILFFIYDCMINRINIEK